MPKQPDIRDSIEDRVLQSHGEFDLTIPEEDLKAVGGNPVVKGGKVVITSSGHSYGLTEITLDRMAGKYHFTDWDRQVLTRVIRSEFAEVGRIIKAPGYVFRKPVEVRFEHDPKSGEFVATHTVPSIDGKGREYYGHGPTRRDAVRMLFDVMAGFQKDLSDGKPVGPSVALFRDYVNTLFKPDQHSS